MASSATVHILVKLPSGETYPVQVHVRPTWFELATTVKNVLLLPSCVQAISQLSFLRVMDGKQEYLFSNAYVDTVELVEGDVLFLDIDSAIYRVYLDYNEDATDYSVNPPRRYNILELEFQRLSSDGRAKRYTTLLYDEYLGGVVEYGMWEYVPTGDELEVIVPDDSPRYTTEEAIDRLFNDIEPISHMGKIYLRESLRAKWEELDETFYEDDEINLAMPMRPKRER